MECLPELPQLIQWVRRDPALAKTHARQVVDVRRRAARAILREMNLDEHTFPAGDAGNAMLLDFLQRCLDDMRSSLLCLDEEIDLNTGMVGLPGLWLPPPAACPKAALAEASAPCALDPMLACEEPGLGQADLFGGATAMEVAETAATDELAVAATETAPMDAGKREEGGDGGCDGYGEDEVIEIKSVSTDAEDTTDDHNSSVATSPCKVLPLLVEDEDSRETVLTTRATTEAVVPPQSPVATRSKRKRPDKAATPATSGCRRPPVAFAPLRSQKRRK